jgi:hypothetical protein
MNANRATRRADFPAVALLWAPCFSTEPAHCNSQTAAATACNSVIAARMMNWFFCIGLWLSLLAAIWISRGWIGLFFSGQVISAGVCLIKSLARRT